MFVVKRHGTVSWVFVVFIGLPYVFVVAPFMRLRLTDRLAIGLVGVSVLAVAVWATADALDEWAPNIATEALSIAVTIAIVDRIVRSETGRRPRVRAALGRIAEALRVMGALVWSEYKTSRETPVVMPEDLVAVLDLWLAAEEEESADERIDDDIRRQVVDEDDIRPQVVDEASRLATELEQLRRDDGDYIEDPLLLALDAFIASVREGADAASHGDLRYGMHAVVEAARDLAAEYGRHATPVKIVSWWAFARRAT